MLVEPVHATNSNGNSSKRLHGYIQHCLDASNVPSRNSGVDSTLTATDIHSLKAKINRLESSNEELKLGMAELASQLGNLVLALEQVSAGQDQENSVFSFPHVGDMKGSSFGNKSKWKPSRPGTIEDTSKALKFPGVKIKNMSMRWQDEDIPSVTTTLEASATAVGTAAERGHLSVDALEALATKSIARSAAKLAHRRSDRLRMKGESLEVAALHVDTCRILACGEVVSAVQNPISSPFGHESFICQLFDPQSGRTVRAIFKPRAPGDSDGWHRPPMEVVAYRLNRLLGMDLVPPAAYRSFGVTLPLSDENGGGSRWFSEGAMIFWAEDAETLCRIDESLWSIPKERLLSDTRILDVLLHNSDRHAGHFLFGRHWASGSWEKSHGGNMEKKWHGNKCCILIDHAASFRAVAKVLCTHENAFETGPLHTVSARTLLFLKLLDSHELSEASVGLLSSDEIAGAMARRDYILNYIDELIEKQGYDKTIID